VYPVGRRAVSNFCEVEAGDDSAFGRGKIALTGGAVCPPPTELYVLPPD